MTWLIFHQLIINWLFSKSTQKGPLKHVHEDGISNPLGSREIQEIKVATVLGHTLYFGQNVLSCCNSYITLIFPKANVTVCCVVLCECNVFNGGTCQ